MSICSGWRQVPERGGMKNSAGRSDAPTGAFPLRASSDKSTTWSQTVQRKLGLARGYLSSVPQQQQVAVVNSTAGLAGLEGGGVGRDFFDGASE